MRKIGRGHRRTVSSNLNEIPAYSNTAPDTATTDDIQQLKTQRTAITLAQRKSQGDQGIASLVEQSSKNRLNKTIVVQQLQTSIHYQDPLFQFGKIKKQGNMKVADRWLGAWQPIQPIKPAVKQQKELFMIPELKKMAKQPTKQSQSSRVTKSTDEEPFIVQSSHSRTNNLMSKTRHSPSQIATRLKVDKREAARYKDIHIMKTKARLNLMHMRAN